MRSNIKIIFLFSVLLTCCGVATSCQKYDLSGADIKTLTLTYDTEGNYLPAFSGQGSSVTKAVVINQGSVYRDIDWTVSVDGDPGWLHVEKTKVVTQFTGTYAGDNCEVEHKAVLITVDLNPTGAKRQAVIRFTVADGSSISTLVTQTK